VRQGERFRGNEKGKYKQLIVLKSWEETGHRSNINWQR